MRFSLFVSGIVFMLGLQAQQFKGSSGLLHQIKQLQNSTRVLYVAAHPDDENTRMISWLVNEKYYTTAYLSLTRGDGGQNLIGTELGAALGVLRTQELMQARSLDGGRQYFSRAVDFGYSKDADETFKKWGHQAILSDVVWTIRSFHPDVIITRFPPDGRGGHGHHTASALLAIEAFEKAGDEKAFPDQLNELSPWHAHSLYWNASSWWNPKLDSIARVDPNVLEVEVGGYNPVVGYSSNEIASLSRTQHKSQGFGVSIARGKDKEYLEYLKGNKAREDIFEEIHHGWARFGFEGAEALIDNIINNFDLNRPQNSVPALLELKEKASAITDAVRREDFRKSIDQIVVQALGLYAEVLADQEYYGPAEEVDVNVEIILRNGEGINGNIMLENIYQGNMLLWSEKKIPPFNEKLSVPLKFNMSENSTEPYWLRAPYENTFEVNDPDLRGLPENPAMNSLLLQFSLQGTSFSMRVPVIHKYSDRVEGEIFHEVNIIPPYTVNITADNLVFTDNEEQELVLEILSQNGGVLNVALSAEGWLINPSVISINTEAGQKYLRSVNISPALQAESTVLGVKVNGKPARSLQLIDYEHTDRRIILSPLEPELVKIDLAKEGELIGYIPGAGDKVAEAISRMGYQVEILDEEKIRSTDLSRFKAIVAGIRAYNTQKWLPAVKPLLDSYVKTGGVYIVQYNTSSRDLLSTDIGPYPFKISRERVTEEDAEPQFLLPGHPLLNYPNKITAADFENWVQERGLYFAGEWDEKYETPLGWNDEGEPLRKGALLIADYGQGAFIYTGISFFRELPAGVEGAYRLLANILSYKPENKNGQ